MTQTRASTETSSSPSRTTTEGATMTNEELRAFYVHYVGAANARDFDAIGKLLHDRVTVNGQGHTREDVVESLKALTSAVPDFKWQIEELFTVNGDIATRLRDTGTPVKTWLGLEPTGKRVDFTEFCSYKVREGRFTEMRFLLDVSTIAQQLQAR